MLLPTSFSGAIIDRRAFYADDYRNDLDWLREYALEHGCAIHAYALMINYMHLLLIPDTLEGPGRLMKRLDQRYVQNVNRAYRRSGTLWEGRYKSCLALVDRCVLECCRYIELNPVRANMAEHPADYPWSSYRANAQNTESKLISPHSIYNQLGTRSAQRRSRHRALFRSQLEPGMIDEIRSATNGNCAGQRIYPKAGRESTGQASGSRQTRTTQETYRELNL